MPRSIPFKDFYFVSEDAKASSTWRTAAVKVEGIKQAYTVEKNKQRKPLILTNKSRTVSILAECKCTHETVLSQEFEVVQRLVIRQVEENGCLAETTRMSVGPHSEETSRSLLPEHRFVRSSSVSQLVEFPQDDKTRTSCPISRKLRSRISTFYVCMSSRRSRHAAASNPNRVVVTPYKSEISSNSRACCTGVNVNKKLSESYSGRPDSFAIRGPPPSSNRTGEPHQVHRRKRHQRENRMRGTGHNRHKQSLQSRDPIRLERAGRKTTILAKRGVYFKPEYIIDSLSTALSKAQLDELVIIMGDQNCRIDVNNQKAEAVLHFLESEGLSLINKSNDKTYMGHNGSNTIDLVLTKMKNRVERRHLPVATTLVIERHKAKPQNHKLSRHLNMQAIEQTFSHVTEARQHIKTGHIDDALEQLEQVIMNATNTTTSNIKSKPWFDKNCYRTRRETLHDLHNSITSPSEKALHKYSQKRREYKALIIESKRKHHEKQSKIMTPEAQKNPYKVLNQRKSMFPRDILIETWTQHYSKWQSITEQAMLSSVNLG
ncbi:hypothetical protein C0J52_18978 [Blattella germanica]|nr:hypothetical protein C0J52_18978 [Blattella germanica]